MDTIGIVQRVLCLYFRGCFVHFSILYVAGTTGSVLIREVSLFQRMFCTFLYIAETTGSVQIREVYLFQSYRSLIERFHCINIQ